MVKKLPESLRSILKYPCQFLAWFRKMKMMQKNLACKLNYLCKILLFSHLFCVIFSLTSWSTCEWTKSFIGVPSAFSHQIVCSMMLRLVKIQIPVRSQQRSPTMEHCWRSRFSVWIIVQHFLYLLQLVQLAVPLFLRHQNIQVGVILGFRNIAV